MPPISFFVFSLAQEVAGDISSALTGCSGLASILKGLENREEPTKKPMAIKRRKLAKAAPQPEAAPKPKAAPKPAAAKAAAAPAGGLAAPPVAGLTDTRKCVHSRAYKAAAKKAKNDCLSPVEISKAACKAGKDAGDKWDIEHA